MKNIKIIFFLILMIVSFRPYAHENNHVLLGLHGNEEKPAFILELFGDDLEDCIRINENGEVYLKVDKIVTITKDNFPHFAYLEDLVSNQTIPYSYTLEGNATLCGGRVTVPPKKWQCPYCYFWWDFGQKCENPNCPINKW